MFVKALMVLSGVAVIIILLIVSVAAWRVLTGRDKGTNEKIRTHEDVVAVIKRNNVNKEVIKHD